MKIEKIILPVMLILTSIPAGKGTGRILPVFAYLHAPCTDLHGFRLRSTGCLFSLMECNRW